MNKLCRRHNGIGLIVYKYPDGYVGPRKKPHFPNPERHRRFVRNILAAIGKEPLV